MQATDAQSGDGPSLQRQLIDRLRFILAIIASMASVFVIREATSAGHPLGLFFAFRLVGAALALTGFFVLRRRWAEEWAWPLTVAIICFAYVFVAAAGMVSPTGEYVTTTILFVGAALVTATLLPWGLRPQCFTVLWGAGILAAVILWTDGSLGALASDPGFVVLMGFALSTVIAREFERYRAAHRHELEERRRAEAEVRALNVTLEGRVRERTAALEKMNDRLAVVIAERKRVHDALRASEQLLADTVDHSSAIVSLKDINGCYLLVNREFERLFGRPREAMVTRRDENLFPADLAALLVAHDRQVLETGAPLSFEQELPIGDGKRQYVCVKFPLRGADGAPYGVGSMSTDITALKQLEETLRQHQDELAHVLRVHTLEEMASAIGHEINQPICAITNWAQGGARRLKSGTMDTAVLLDVLEKIGVQGMRAGTILRSIRSLIRRDSGKATAFDLRALAGEAVRLLRPQARRHGVTIRLESGQTLPAVNGNPTQIEQVMVNLILNGVQAAAADGPVRREVVVAATHSSDAVEVAVSDSGSGIAADVAGQLFSPFVTTKANGLGLGLAISRTIVENHGGRLWATSTPETGATFHFSLPLAPESSKTPPGVERTQSSAASK